MAFFHRVPDVLPKDYHDDEDYEYHHWSGELQERLKKVLLPGFCFFELLHFKGAILSRELGLFFRDSASVAVVYLVRVECHVDPCW